MLWPIVSLVLLSLSLVIAGVVLARKVSQLRMIDVASIPSERVKRVKEQIILQKFERIGAQKMGAAAKVARQGVSSVSKVGRRAVQKLYAMEQYYQKLKHSAPDGSHAVNADTIKRLLEEAENLVSEEEYIPAEKRYIEVISHNPKHVKAYEGLGNLYLANKQYAQARETLLFTQRLSKDDPSVQMSLADVELAEGNTRKAVDYLRNVVALRPGNPKFLDLYIESAIEVRLTIDAQKGIALLKESNPDNQKIPDFEARLAKLIPKPSQPAEPLV